MAVLTADKLATGTRFLGHYVGDAPQVAHTCLLLDGAAFGDDRVVAVIEGSAAGRTLAASYVTVVQELS